MRIPSPWARCAPYGVLVLGFAGAGLGCAWVDSILWRPPPDPVPVSGRPPLAAGNAVSGRAVHVVHFGDTLWDISRSHGVAVDELAQANGIADADRIEVGQRLVIPASSPPPLSNLGAGSARDAAAPAPHPASRHVAEPTLPSVASRVDAAPAADAVAARREASLKRSRADLDAHRPLRGKTQKAPLRMRLAHAMHSLRPSSKEVVRCRSEPAT